MEDFMNQYCPSGAQSLGYACLLILALAISIEGQVTAPGKDRTASARAAFANESVKRLSDKGNSDEIRQLQQIWQTTKSQTDWLKLADAINLAAVKAETKSSVTIASSGGSGATVKYQTLAQRLRNETPTTARTSTVANESMYIGAYYIWSVREGKPTSDIDAQYQIARTKETVVLEESNKNK